MPHAARILADSLSPDGVRLTTLEVTFPRIVLAEFNTHRMLSRNSASSRAIPVVKMVERLLDDPYIPTHWSKNQKGMQADEEIDGENFDRAVGRWLKARDSAIEHARVLLEYGVHKQITNRLLEPFMWHTVICTGTEFSNFFALRCHPDAHPEIRKAAELMRDAMAKSAPRKLDYGQWHRPLVDEWASWAPANEMVHRTPEQEEYWNKISIARCARVSYLTHDGRRDVDADLQLYEKLASHPHLSPLEHVARPMDAPFERDHYRRWEVKLSDGHVLTTRHPTEVGEEWDEGVYVTAVRVTHLCGNLDGWIQFRKTIPNEHDFSLVSR